MDHLHAIAFSCALLASACASSAEPPAANTEPSHAPSAETTGGETTEDDGPAAEEAALPATFEPGHGEDAVGVYLARVTPGNPNEAQELLAELSARGVEGGGSGELNCDRGAAETLSLPGETIVVSVAFRTAQEAAAFVEGWGREVLGVSPFTAYCRD